MSFAVEYINPYCNNVIPTLKLFLKSIDPKDGRYCVAGMAGAAPVGSSNVSGLFLA